MSGEMGEEYCESEEERARLKFLQGMRVGELCNHVCPMHSEEMLQALDLFGYELTDWVLHKVEREDYMLIIVTALSNRIRKLEEKLRENGIA